MGDRAPPRLYLPQAYIRAVLEALHTTDGIIAILEALGSDIHMGIRMATCILPSHGDDEHHSVSIGGPGGEAGKWHCWSEGCGGDGLSLLARHHGVDQREHFAELIREAGDILGLTPPERGRDAAREWRSIQRRAITARTAAPKIVAMPRPAQQRAFTALLDACDACAPRSCSAAETHLWRERGIHPSVQERCGWHRLVSGVECAAIGLVLSNSPDAGICEASGILARDERSGTLRLAWSEDSLLLFSMPPDFSGGPLYCRARTLRPLPSGANRYRAPHGRGGALPTDIAPAAETTVVRDVYAGGTREVTRHLRYRSQPVIYGLPQLGEAAASGKLAVMEGAIKAMGMVALGHNAVAMGGRLGWDPSTPTADRAASGPGQMITDLGPLVDAEVAVVPDYDEDAEKRARGVTLAETLAEALAQGHGLNAVVRSMRDYAHDRVGRVGDRWIKDADDVVRIYGAPPQGEF